MRDDRVQRRADRHPAISPLWLQIGPDFANVGAGLSAAAIGTISYPPLAVDGDICVAGNWVAQANFGPLSASTGGSWLGPFNVVGNGALCPFGDAGGGDPPATPTSTGLASSTNPSAPGDEVTFTASVTPTPDGGTVSFTDNGEDVADCQDVVVDESGNAPCAVTFDDPGSHTIVATFSGNDGFAGSASSTVDQVVSDAPPATPTSTGLVPSLNPSSPGDEVTFTATVSPAPGGGTVSFTDAGEPIDDCQDLAVDEAGVATCAVTFDEPGSHAIVATFSGDETFEGSASSTLDQVVTDGPLPEPTATELVASSNPSAPGQPVAFTASVSPIPDGGRVSFTDNGEDVADCQDVALDPSGGATCTVTYATVGTHAIVATYERPRCVRGFGVLDARAGGERRHAADRDGHRPRVVVQPVGPRRAADVHGVGEPDARTAGRCRSPTRARRSPSARRSRSTSRVMLCVR